MDSLKRNFDMYGITVTAIDQSEDQGRKHETWELLRTLNRKSDLPSLFYGYFNVTLFHHEKESSHSANASHIRGFRCALEESDLYDLGYNGPKFTWSNNREALAIVKVRLDRALACS
ncbi:UNVERIFIED_CONTAM: hypothetical protein Sradi_0745400 [Sesamum radiatum]|uniref:Uncharacterized protein n=1 Tax=Sesamum radiatum TaxID=300843 RepID=A0AAW2VNR6_SESRA